MLLTSKSKQLYINGKQRYKKQGGEVPTVNNKKKIAREKQNKNNSKSKSIAYLKRNLAWIFQPFFFLTLGGYLEMRDQLTPHRDSEVPWFGPVVECSGIPIMNEKLKN